MALIKQKKYSGLNTLYPYVNETNMVTTESRQALLRRLNDIGFNHDGRPDKECRIYTRSVKGTNIVLDLQVWSNGEHRVTRMVNGCGQSTPTSFTTIDGMMVAILHELTEALRTGK